MDDRPQGETLFVFIDESGNFDFSDKGSDYLIEAAVVTRDPLAIATQMQGLRYDLLREGHRDLEFHAAENKQEIRDRVYAVIADCSTLFHAHVLYLNKHRAAPAMQNKAAMVALFARAFARWLDLNVAADVGEVVMLFDSVLTKREQSAFRATLKPELKKLGVQFALSFAPVKTEPVGQVADYVAWAYSRRLERRDERPIAQLRGVALTEFDLFRRGHTKYY